MTRESWVYPSDGSEPYIKGAREGAREAGYFIAPDLPDFVSPIDGKEYCGRSGLREHNLRNNVVLNADLKGLPTLQMNSDTRSSEQKRRHAQRRKEAIIQGVYKHVTGD